MEHMRAIGYSIKAQIYELRHRRKQDFIGVENVFNKIPEKKPPKLGKEMFIQQKG